MRRRFLRWFGIALMLALSTGAAAQEFEACLSETNTILRVSCAGGNPAPDGSMLAILWDANGNGPDLSDNHPPAGSVNFEYFLLNGQEQLGQPGLFTMVGGVCLSGEMLNPPRFYLWGDFYAQNSHATWTSNVFTVVPGMQQIELGDWTCNPGQQPPFMTCLAEYTSLLTTTCGGSTPVPDGTPMLIYWDQNFNGPDPWDELAPVCVQYPDCDLAQGALHTFNGVQGIPFLMNGGYQLGTPGMFYCWAYLVSIGYTPSVPRYYVVVQYGQTRWTSDVFVVPPGPSDIEIPGWTCETLTSCSATPVVHFSDYDPVAPADGPQCIQLCPGSTVPIWVGPVANVGMLPTGHVETGCPGCNEPASGVIFDDAAWQYYQTVHGHFYANTVSLSADGAAGCATFVLDAILPVEMGEFTAVAGDRAVELRWNTHSESGLASFEVRRRATVVHRTPATNGTTEQHYRFTERELENGHRYEYALVAVNLDGSQTTLGTASATPSADLGVAGEYALHQNYPNPFNPVTQIRFDVAEPGVVTLKVFNLAGQEVATLNNSVLSAGRHAVSFDASALPSGIYLYRLTAGVFTAERKMLLLK